MADWAERPDRIGAAIEKAEHEIHRATHVAAWCVAALDFTAGEVALAKDLWERWNHIGPLSREASGNNWVEPCACGYSHDFDFDCEAVVLAPPPAALRTFVEKVEAL